MGPRLVSRGRPHDVPGIGQELRTSMGPRLVSRGRRRRATGGRRQPHFNGATAGEPWKTAMIVIERRSPSARFNGATAGEPWKTATSRRSLTIGT